MLNQIDWNALAAQYKTQDTWWMEEYFSPDPPKPKPPRIEFNVKAKGWKPKAEKFYINGEHLVKHYMDTFGVGNVIEASGKKYMLDKDEKGLYYYELYD